MREDIEKIRFPLPEERIFDEIIDVRAPGEFAVDHITGALNLPVLWDEERKRIGTQYKQESTFAAQKAGAALVSGNIQRHLDGHFSGKPENYRPLIYCFRGGQRSRSLATVLEEIGWPVAVVQGGYKAYRRHVLKVIEEKPASLSFRVVNGLTGSGKTLILHALEELGAQVLDLEGLASHKGSVFGENLENPQPAQKRFESLIHDQLNRFDPARPIFVEAESPKIGRLNLPLPLRSELAKSPVLEIVSPLESRVEFLLGDYESWLTDPERVLVTIGRLKEFHPPATIDQWRTWCQAGQWRELIGDLLTRHYDRHYGTNGEGNYRKPDQKVMIPDQSRENVRTCAESLMHPAKIECP